MKKFILALMVVATLVSCGKDNKVSSGAPAAGTNPLTGTAINDTSAVALASLVDNYSTSFGLGQVFINQNYY